MTSISLSERTSSFEVESTPTDFALSAKAVASSAVHVAASGSAPSNAFPFFFLHVARNCFRSAARRERLADEGDESLVVPVGVGDGGEERLRDEQAGVAVVHSESRELLRVDGDALQHEDEQVLQVGGVLRLAADAPDRAPRVLRGFLALKTVHGALLPSFRPSDRSGVAGPRGVLVDIRSFPGWGETPPPAAARIPDADRCDKTAELW